MRSLCQHSRRWHQQFYQSIHRGSHQNCLIKPPAIRQYRQRIKSRPVESSASSRPQEDLKVREFEQIGPSSKDVVEVNPKAETEEAAKDLRAEIDRLEQELAVLREGPFGPNSDFMRALSPDDRAKALKALEDEGLAGDELDDLVADEELDHIFDKEDSQRKSVDVTSTAGVTLRIPAQQKAYARQFNKALQAVAENDIDQERCLRLWKWYLRCQQHILGFTNLISEDVWQSLWHSQSSFQNRSKHLVMLAKDMLSIDMPLTPAQWVTYIESLLSERDFGSAILLWEEKRNELGPDSTVASSFWPLGVHIYCDLGKPIKAQKIAFECLDHGALVEPQILIPVIAAWAKSKDSNASTKAWVCYLRLRSELADGITALDFEKTSTKLLTAGKADLALAVFKDMLVSKIESADDSQAIYRAIIDHIQDLQSREVSEENINRVSLSALLVLPKSFQNKFFYGSWIKRLIGSGEVDAAAAVVELMYERGVKLDAKHLNGVVGAWLREGSPTSRDKAEKMAWAMIHERIAFVQRRTGAESLSNLEAVPVKYRQRATPQFLLRRVPSANIETFSILLLHYTRRSQHQAAEKLTSMMIGPAQIHPNSFIMNHWLYAALRKSDIESVWLTYEETTRTLRPDLNTFACLWDAAKIQYDKSKIAHSARFPSARLIYAEFSEWYAKPEALKRAKSDFSQDLYDQIIRCFCLSLDLKGTLCALHGLQQMFGQYPDPNTTRMIVSQISRMLPAELKQNTARRTMRRKPSHLRDTTARVAEILDTVADQRSAGLLVSGIDPDEMSETDIKKTQLQILSTFIIVILKRLEGLSGNAENSVKAVAKVMGVDPAGIDFADIETEV